MPPDSYARYGYLGSSRVLANKRRLSRAGSRSAVALGGCLALAFLLGVGPMLLGWVLMLVLGGLHHSVWFSVPALGYWPSVLVVFALSVVRTLLFGGFRVNVSRAN